MRQGFYNADNCFRNNDLTFLSKALKYRVRFGHAYWQSAVSYPIAASVALSLLKFVKSHFHIFCTSLIPDCFDTIFSDCCFHTLFPVDFASDSRAFEFLYILLDAPAVTTGWWSDLLHSGMAVSYTHLDVYKRQHYYIIFPYYLFLQDQPIYSRTANFQLSCNFRFTNFMLLVFFK